MKDGVVYSRILAVAGLAAVVYLNSLFGEFVFDDHEAIESNRDVRSNTPLSRVFLDDFWGLPLSDVESHKSYRPLTTLSFRGNHLLHGLWAPGFHAVNILLHSLVSALFFVLCSAMALPPSLSLTAGLLFAVHPIHTEAVANIVGRTEPLSALFFLLSLLSYHCSVSPRASLTSMTSMTSVTPVKRYSYMWLSLAILFGGVAMLCKEQGVTVLGVCLVYDIIVVNNFDLKEFLALFGRLLCRRSPAPPSWFKSLLQRILIVLLSATAILSFRIYLNGGGPPRFIESDNPASFSPHFLTRLLTYAYLNAVNLWLLVCPSRLCFDWSMDSIPLVEGWSDGRNMYTLGALVVVALLIIYGTGFLRMCRSKDVVFECPTPSLEKNTNNSNSNDVIATHHLGETPLLHTPEIQPNPKKPYKRILSQPSITTTTSREQQLTLFSLSLLLLPFLPASNLLFPVGFVLAERVLYLPSMGACLLVAMGIQHVKSKYAGCSAIINMVLCLSLLAFSVKTVVRNFEWKDELKLAESAVPVNPTNAKVYMTIGNFYAQQGNRKCESFYREALRLRPHYTAAWTNLGLVLLNTERPDEAEQCYQRALSIQSDHINANTNMGHLCRLQERWKEAWHYYNTTLARRPNNPIIRYYLGYVLERTENTTGAEEEYLHAISLHPKYWEAHLALARLLSTTSINGRKLQYGFTKGKRLDKALQHYQRSLALQPKSLEARYELGKIYLWKGLYRAAEREFMTAVQIFPTHAKSLLELGLTYEQLGYYKKAAKQFETVLNIDPTLTIAKRKLQELKDSKRLKT